jgi:hypothetical protein
VRERWQGVGVRQSAKPPPQSTNLRHRQTTSCYVCEIKFSRTLLKYSK